MLQIPPTDKAEIYIKKAQGSMPDSLVARLSQRCARTHVIFRRRGGPVHPFQRDGLHSLRTRTSALELETT